MAKRNPKPVKLVGDLFLDVLRLLKAGQLAPARAMVESHIQTSGTADLFAPNKYDQTMFGEWATADRPEAIDWLEPHGIPWTPHLAARWGRLDILKKLAKEDSGCLTAKQSSRVLKTPLSWAIYHNHLHVARWLLEMGQKIDDGKTDYMTDAVFGRHEEAMRFVAEHGGLPDGPKKPWRTALHHECNHGHTRLVPLLLELGADPNAPDPNHDGGTAMHLAAQRGSAVKLVQMLIDAGGDPNARNDKGETPLDIASRARQPYVAKLLEGLGTRRSSNRPRDQNS